MKASHILISAAGRVCLSGFRDVCSMVQNGERLKCVYSYPTHPQKLLQWFSPEILAQVNYYLPVKLNDQGCYHFKHTFF